MRNIGILFDINEGWIGGSYYLRNLVAALGMLPAEEQPVATLISARPDSVRFMQETGYPHLRWLDAGAFNAAPGRFPLDALFPWAPPSEAARTVSWIPDFQELHLPYYCSPDEIANRRRHYRQRFATAGLVVSSEAVRRDVEQFFPGECRNVAVVHFATFDHFDRSRQASVRAAYGLTGPYVMCANQVWVHKNHILILKALAILKARGLTPTVCFTGNESDYRVKGFSTYLRDKAAEWGIADTVRFLGFIPRDDQLNLMAGAQYVVQPSLFEGWSTVVEDAKAMGQFVVASDLDVHKEQLTGNCRFFARHDPDALAAIMADLAQSPQTPGPQGDYNEARRSFGRDFLAAITAFLPPDRAAERSGPDMMTSAEFEAQTRQSIDSLASDPQH
ncbi:MAG: glycosyltransferase family 4 protein [Rhodobacterales bacterium]|nr:glycosyltransferase family 4 protein [Rhodobacterales bacterium]